MSSEEFHSYTRDEFLDEFFPDAGDRADIAAGMEQLRAEQRAYRLAEQAGTDLEEKAGVPTSSS